MASQPQQDPHTANQLQGTLSGVVPPNISSLVAEEVARQLKAQAMGASNSIGSHSTKNQKSDEGVQTIKSLKLAVVQHKDWGNGEQREGNKMWATIEVCFGFVYSLAYG